MENLYTWSWWHDPARVRFSQVFYVKLFFPISFFFFWFQFLVFWFLAILACFVIESFFSRYTYIFFGFIHRQQSNIFLSFLPPIYPLPHWARAYLISSCVFFFFSFLISKCTLLFMANKRSSAAVSFKTYWPIHFFLHPPQFHLHVFLFILLLFRIFFGILEEGEVERNRLEWEMAFFCLSCIWLLPIAMYVASLGHCPSQGWWRGFTERAVGCRARAQRGGAGVRAHVADTRRWACTCCAVQSCPGASGQGQ